MANLTLVIEDDVLLRARKRALDQGTSVNAVLRGYLENYAGRQDRVDAGRETALSAPIPGTSGRCRPLPRYGSLAGGADNSAVIRLAILAMWRE